MCRAAWKATCRCFAPPPNNCSRGSVPTMWRASAPLAERSPSAARLRAIEVSSLRRYRARSIRMRSRPTRPTSPGIGPGGLQAALMADMPDPGLARVAEETGGGYTEIRFGEDLGAAFAGVADELHTQYLLGFAPSKRDGKVHDINVRVTQGGLKPRARKSYLAAKD